MISKPLAEIPDGGTCLLGEDVLVGRQGDVVCAVRNRCPHQYLPLEGGDLEEWSFRCPHHGILFDMRDGSVLDDRGFQDLEPLTVLPNSTRNETVYVDE